MHKKICVMKKTNDDDTSRTSLKAHEAMWDTQWRHNCTETKIQQEKEEGTNKPVNVIVNNNNNRGNGRKKILSSTNPPLSFGPRFTCIALPLEPWCSMVWYGMLWCHWLCKLNISNKRFSLNEKKGGDW